MGDSLISLKKLQTHRSEPRANASRRKEHVKILMSHVQEHFNSIKALRFPSRCNTRLAFQTFLTVGSQGTFFSHVLLHSRAPCTPPHNVFAPTKSGTCPRSSRCTGTPFSAWPCRLPFRRLRWRLITRAH